MEINDDQIEITTEDFIERENYYSETQAIKTFSNSSSLALEEEISQKYWIHRSSLHERFSEEFMRSSN